MELNEATNNEDIQRGAALREEQNKARSLMQAGTRQKVTGKAMRATGKVVDKAGEVARRGGTAAIKAGARLSSTGAGIIVGAPLMALGGVAAGAGLVGQGIGKATGYAGRGVEKGGRTAIRQAIQAKRNAAALQKNNDEGEGMISGAAQATTSGLLKTAWINLIPTWGLTLLWINTHVFLRWVFPSFFCKLGHEWIPKFMTRFTGKSTAMIEIGEKMLLAILDVIAAFVIIGTIMIIIKIVETASSGGTATNSILTAISPALGLASSLYQMAK